MACKIRVLDEKTINQIAAGEVIENPASVVKELIDNAIDAEASKIVIEAQGSGRQSILVQDNGSGMGSDDALLCLERHATSKIRSFDDLWSLSTMGFRGEALASIASVSDLSILTAINDAKSGKLLEGTAISTSGGKILSCTQTQCFGGTSIEVKSLFHNVPARRKFQKSPTKDATDIIKMVMQMALAHPHIGFELIVNGKKELQLDPSCDPSFSDRIKAVLGQDYFGQLTPLEYTNEQISLKGFVGKPSAVKSTRSGQYLFVNSRPISSYLISSAVKEAYGTSIETDRHPIFVLYAEAASDLVDVNVHPQKREVRFHIEEEIRRACREGVSKAIFKVPVAPASVYEAPRSFASPIEPRIEPNLESRVERKFEFPDTSSYLFREKPLQIERQIQTQQPTLPGIEESIRIVGTLWHYLFASICTADPRITSAFPDSGDDMVYLIDCKLALSRITFETVMDGKDKESIQTLLVPVFIELSSIDAQKMQEKLPLLQQIGVNIYEFGVSSFLVDAVPSTLKNVDIAEWIRSMVLEQEAEIDLEAEKRRIALLSSRSQKIPSPLSNEFALQIIKTLLSCRDPLRCPLGFPTISIMTRSELMKKFQTKA